MESKQEYINRISKYTRKELLKSCHKMETNEKLAEMLYNAKNNN